jgi:predicted permease
VEIRLWHTAAAGVEEQASYDLAVWRERLGSVEGLGAYRSIERNVITEMGGGDPVMGAEISASAFVVTRVPPLMGRPLIDSDEVPGAPAVVVIGYDLWQRRFGGEADVIGRSIRVGGTEHTVVGVMPAGYGFPVAHELWVPLRLHAWAYSPREGPGIDVFGRLAPGVALEQAQAELTALGLAAAAERPETHEHLRPEILPYGRSLFGVRGLASFGLYSMNLFFVLFLALVCANVALLVFARTATRESELVVRSALGASRRRIVMQLFTEALVLGVCAAIVGLVAGDLALGRVLDVLEVTTGGDDQVPFWFHRGLSPVTVLYASGLTVLGAAVAGMLPAFKATARGVQSRLREAATGGGRLSFGGVWTAVIVTQVALTVVFVPIVGQLWRDTAEIRSADLGFRAGEYLSAQLVLDRETGAYARMSDEAFRTRFDATVGEIVRRLETEPAVTGVTFASELPGGYHIQQRIEVEGVPRPPRSPGGHQVQMAHVAPDFFDVLNVLTLSGRPFRPSDAGPDARVVIVNETFVDRVMGGRNPVGRRLRYTCRGENCREADALPGPWLEIVGVVPDLAMAIDRGPPIGLYHPRALAAVETYEATYIAAHVRGDPRALAPRLQSLASEIDPGLRLYEVQPMEEASYRVLLSYEAWLGVIGAGGALLVLLALAGIYSVMAFTVSRRTREIGIRIALGADGRSIVFAVFARTFMQVGLGFLVGTGMFAGLVILSGVGSEGGLRFSARDAAVFLSYTAVALAICVLACITPVRRALRIEPIVALRAD